MEGPREMEVVYEDENYVGLNKPFDFRMVLPAHSFSPTRAGFSFHGWGLGCRVSAKDP